MSKRRPGWIVLGKEPLPRPTVWPAAVGLGFVLACLGLLTRPPVFWVGCSLFSLGVFKWVKEVWDEA